MIYVPESKADEFFERLKAHITETFKDQVYTKIINEFHCKRILSYLQDHGGELVIGSAKYDEKTKSIERTVIKNPWKDSVLAKNEVFGPIMKVFTYKDFD